MSEAGATTPQQELPRWDLTNVYSGLEGEDYRSDLARLEALLSACETQFDECDIRRHAATPSDDAAVLANSLERVLESVNEVALVFDALEGIVYAYFTTDSYDPQPARELSKLERFDVRRRQLGVRLEGWLGSLDARLDEVITTSRMAQEYEDFLRRSAERSRFRMGEDLEALAAELCVDGGGAFGKLQGNLTSQLKVSLERDGQIKELPIAEVHNLCSHADRELRRRAYEAECKGWASVRTGVAASLNSVKGTAVTLARRRGRSEVLDEALEDNRIDRRTLDALLGAIREAFPIFRCYLQSKATKLGLKRLAWWDLMAPVGSADQHFTWQQARELIVERFAGFSEEMGSMAAAAFDRNWIDAGPRDGKRGGAFCMSISRVEESRILANFDHTIDGVSTLAHELGHAFHNHCQRGLPMLLRGAPMTLAETASIFCETLVAEAALADADPGQQLGILETQLSGATQVCLDISSRFLFESRVIERRAASELSPDELCELMRTAQAETYADAVDADTYHPYMWLWKPHYYVFDGNYYNFPYAFGHLFGLGLYALYREHGVGFVDRYTELLRDTGRGDAATLAARFGIDIRDRAFWQTSLRMVEEQVARYEEL